MDTVVQQDRLEMTEAEWQARCDLAALYRITDLFGWTYEDFRIDDYNPHPHIKAPVAI